MCAFLQIWRWVWLPCHPTHLTLFGPAFFWCIRDPGGGLNIFGLGGVWVPILVGNDLPRHDLPYSKGFMKFGCQEPSKKLFDLWNFILSKRPLTQFVFPLKGPPLWNVGISDELYLFEGNQINIQGKTWSALFQTHNWEKSSFLTHSYAYLNRYTQIHNK